MSLGIRRGVQAALVALGGAAFVWTLLADRFRTVAGGLDPSVGVVWAIGLGLVAIGLALHSTYLRASYWLALALLGQACALQLIDAGTQVQYQHYRPLLRLWASPYLWVLIAQAALVAAGLWRHVPGLLRAVRGALAGWRLVPVLLLFGGTSAFLSRGVGSFAEELLFATCVQLIGLGNFVLVARAAPRRAVEWLGRVIGDAKTGDSGSGVRVDRLVLMGAVWVVLVAGLLNVLSYQRHPHVPDEIVYLMHARYFAQGRLSLPIPPVEEAFRINLMFLDAGKWYSPVPPGWPAMLAVGAFLGVPWLVNPVLAGVNVVLAYLLVSAVHDRRTARLAVLLLCASPWYLFMAMNFMTHTFTLTAALLGAVCVTRLRHSGLVRWGWLAGAATGVVSLVRPLEGLAVAILLGLWTLGIRGRRFRFAPVLSVALGSVLVGGSALYYNYLMTGDPTVFPIMAFTEAHYGPYANALGFGANRGLPWPGLDPFPGHGLRDVIVNAALNVTSINIELFGWMTGSLLLLIAFVLSRRFMRRDGLWLAAIAVVAGIHSFYWFSGGPDFGARYWYLVIVPCVALTARGILALAGTGEVHGEWRRTPLFAAALSLAALTTFVPWRATDKYYHYRDMRPDIRVMAKREGFGRSLVIIRGQRHPDYASAAIYNPLDLEADVPIYVWDRTTESTEAVIAHYADRAIWIVDGPTVTGGGYEVRAGPLDANQARAVMEPSR